MTPWHVNPLSHPLSLPPKRHLSPLQTFKDRRNETRTTAAYYPAAGHSLKAVNNGAHLGVSVRGVTTPHAKTLIDTQHLPQTTFLAVLLFPFTPTHYSPPLTRYTDTFVSCVRVCACVCQGVSVPRSDTAQQTHTFPKRHHLPFYSFPLENDPLHKHDKF